MTPYRPPSNRYERPSDEYIIGKVKIARELAMGLRQITDQAEQAHQLSQDTIEHMIQLFRGKVNLNLPEDKMYVGFTARTSKPSDIIFRVMGMLTAPMNIQYVASMSSTEKREASDAIEGFLNNLDPWFVRRYRRRYSDEALFWQLLVGKSYIQQTFLPYYWNNEERSRKDGESDDQYNDRVDGYKAYMGPPWFRESLDPRTVFPIDTPMGPEAWVKSYTVQRYEMIESFDRVGKRLVFDRNGGIDDIIDLKKRRGLQLPKYEGDALTSSVEYYEYIDERFVYYLVEGKVIHAYDHEGTLCISPAYGLQTGFKEADLMAVGLLWSVRNEIPQFDFLRTLWMQKAYLDVFPQLMAQLAEGDSPITDEKGAPVKWEIEPGTVKQIRGKLVNALSDAATGIDFRALMEMIAGDIDLATIPSLARGVGGAQQAGFAINQLNQSMRTMWKPIIESRQLQRSYLDEKLLTSTRDVIQERMHLFAEIDNDQTGKREGHYMTLDPDDIEPYFQVIAELTPELPIDLQGQMMTGAALHERGHITFEEMTRDFFRKTNPVQRRKDIIRDAAQRAWLPKALEDAMALGRVALTNEVIRERGLDRLNAIGNIDVQALKEARQTQQSQMQGQAPPTDPTRPQVPGGNGMSPSLGEGMGIPPTAGANPADPQPGPRVTGG